MMTVLFYTLIEMNLKNEEIILTCLKNCVVLYHSHARILQLLRLHHANVDDFSYCHDMLHMPELYIVRNELNAEKIQ